MPLWSELAVLMLAAYGGGLTLGWALFARRPRPRPRPRKRPLSRTNPDPDTGIRQRKTDD